MDLERPNARVCVCCISCVASCHSARYRCNGHEFQYACIWSFFSFKNALTCLIILFVCGAIEPWIFYWQKSNQSGGQTTNTEQWRKNSAVHVSCVQCHVVFMLSHHEISIPVCCLWEIEKPYYHFIAAATLTSLHIPKIKDTTKMHFDFEFIFIYEDKHKYNQTRSLWFTPLDRSEMRLFLNVNVRFWRTGVALMVLFG